ncbi:Rab GTPase-like A5A protein [Actinidia rufa]|uniref:Rab GTPase-like A5A protein n=1 Tax=Actinidia rufa TaxID=165716 RepID=A0A7J0DZL7_9ERIC|nr:Rab GTPase-like A5A protein [Actinidia rufa]
MELNRAQQLVDGPVAMAKCRKDHGIPNDIRIKPILEEGDGSLCLHLHESVRELHANRVGCRCPYAERATTILFARTFCMSIIDREGEREKGSRWRVRFRRRRVDSGMDRRQGGGVLDPGCGDRWQGGQGPELEHRRPRTIPNIVNQERFRATRWRGSPVPIRGGDGGIEKNLGIGDGDTNLRPRPAPHFHPNYNLEFLPGDDRLWGFLKHNRRILDDFNDRYKFKTDQCKAAIICTNNCQVGEEEEADFKSRLISGLSGTELEVALADEDAIEESASDVVLQHIDILREEIEVPFKENQKIKKEKSSRCSFRPCLPRSCACRSARRPISAERQRSSGPTEVQDTPLAIQTRQPKDKGRGDSRRHRGELPNWHHGGPSDHLPVDVADLEKDDGEMSAKLPVMQGFNEEEHLKQPPLEEEDKVVHTPAAEDKDAEVNTGKKTTAADNTRDDSLV